MKSLHENKSNYEDVAMANKRRKVSFLPSIKKHVVRVFKSEWFSQVTDGRHKRNRIWNFDYALEVLLVGLLGGAKTLREVETESMLYDERLPDTTLENLMAKADASGLAKALAEQVKQAARDHELDKAGLPFHLIAIDGKANYSTDKEVSEQSKEINHYGKYKKCQHMNLRAMIVSSKVKLHLGQREIASKKAETSEFIPFVDELMELYGKTDLLNVVSVDAGMAHRKNAKALRERGIHFIMGLKENQKTIYRKSQELLGGLSQEQADTCCEESYNGKKIAYRLYRTTVTGNFASMPEISQVWRIEKEIVSKTSGERIVENRYYISSIPFSDIRSQQCLKAVRAHWGIENNGNWTLDCVFGEDNYPLTTRAMRLVAYMRMLACNCIARFKYRKLRKPDNREMSWRRLQEFFQAALRQLRAEQKSTKEFIPAFV
jgi:predicted transposase YbfD/YdcC